MTVQLIGAEELARLTPYGEFVPALEVRLAAGAPAVVSPQRHHHLPSGESDALLIMPAWSDSGFMVVKLLTAYAGNAARGLPTIAGGVVALFDKGTGGLLALFDGLSLTARRTAALGAAASRRLMRADARRLLVVGTGSLAPELAAAHLAVHPFAEVVIHGRHREKAARIVADLAREHQTAFRVGDELAAEVRQADVVVTVTSAAAPIIAAEDVRPGTHLTLMGSFTAMMAEVEPALFPRTSLYADTREGVLEKGGEVLQAIRAGLIGPEALIGDFATLAGATGSSRRSHEEITAFKSVGFAALDLAMAEYAYQRLGADGR